MSSPTVSVVMSVYNGQRYLRQAVASILQQTFADFEFIIIDDGSTDETWQILARYAAQDPRVVLYRNQENMGVARSINGLFTLARGRYITRHDADDVSAADRLAEQVAFLEANPNVGLVSSLIQVIDSEGAPVAGFAFFSTETENEALQQQLLMDCHLCQGSVLFRRRHLEAVGVYDESLAPTEDYDLWLRLAEVTELGSLDKVLYSYRRHAESASSRQFHQQILNKAAALDRAIHRRFGGQPAARYRGRAAHYYLQAYFAKNRHGDQATARSSLARALALCPTLLDEAEPLRALAVDYTATGDVEADLRLAEIVFADLLPTRAVTRLRSWLLSRLHMREVFAAARDGDHARRDIHLWPGIRHDPTWLLNRGVISILARTLWKRLSGSASSSQPARIKRVYLTVYIWSDAGGIEQVITSLACSLKRAGTDVVVFAWRNVASQSAQYQVGLERCRVRLVDSRGFLGRLAWNWEYRVQVVERLVRGAQPIGLPLQALRALQLRGDWARAGASVRGRLRSLLLRALENYTLDTYMRARLTLAHWLYPGALVNQHGHGSPAALQWAIQRRIPTVYSEQNTPDAESSRADWQFIAPVLNQVDGVSAVSAGAARGLAEFLGVDLPKIAIIPQPIEFSSEDPGAADLGMGAEPACDLQVIGVGRLHSMKGFGTLVEAAHILKERGRTFRVKLVGDGPDHESLAAMVQAKKLESCVTFLGRLDHDQLPAVYRRGDVFACPSLHLEGLPLVVAEAMAFGLPVVASDIPAHQGLVIHHHNGLLFPPGDACALAEALDCLLSNPAERQRMGEASRQRFESGEFSPSRIAGQYLKVYQQAHAAATARNQFVQPETP